MTARHAAVIDIGKTNAKLALVDLATLDEVAVLTRPNAVRPGPPWPHFDTEGHWRFLLDGLRRFQADHGVDAISITTHGAALALLDRAGDLAAPVLDYEHDGPDSAAADYDAIRPGFDVTGAPRLPGGLNAGAQLFWQFGTDPGLAARTRTIVTWPQYWAHRLCGVAASDVCSLGCHTDLWNPWAGEWSPLVARLGLEGRLAPPRPPGDVLGPVLGSVAADTGLAPGTPVLCGIHDSNASLLPHLLSRQAPFGVVSSGTWAICMAVGGGAVALDPARDTLVNVDARGAPVPSARFMGGREHDLALAGGHAEATDADIARLLERGAMLLPALVPGTGPFPHRRSAWAGGEPAPGSGDRAAAVGFYLALVTARCLALIGHRGPVVVEGPFARNRCYRLMLGAATGAPVLAMGGATGTSQGAALLVPETRPRPRPPLPADPSDPARTAALRAYAAAWSRRAGP